MHPFEVSHCQTGNSFIDKCVYRFAIRETWDQLVGVAGMAQMVVR